MDKKEILIVVDMQNDFIDGALANPAAAAIAPGIAELVSGWEGPIVATLDTHGSDYLDTHEGSRLPIVHCVVQTKGWEIEPRIAKALESKHAIHLLKTAFAYLPWHNLGEPRVPGGRFLPLIDTDGSTRLTLVGTCTDICVISNALLLRSLYRDADVRVVEDLCAGTTPERHAAAIEVMRSCHIDVVTLDDLRKEENQNGSQDIHR